MPLTESPSEKVLYEKDERIAQVTINRPEARNAIDPETHEALCEIWADFRDDDAVDVAILTGAGEAFCAGADLKTYIPPIIEDVHPAADPRDRRARARRPDPRPAPDPEAGDRRRQRLGARRRARDGARLRHPDRRRERDVRLVRGAARLPPRRRRHRPARQHLRGRGRDADAAHGRADRRPAGAACNLVTKVVPDEDLAAEADLIARQILRNSQRAVRSAKETILDVIGQQLDQQLRHEAWNAYTSPDPDETMRLLNRFYDKTDAGRAGRHETDL